MFVFLCTKNDFLIIGLILFYNKAACVLCCTIYVVWIDDDLKNAQNKKVKKLKLVF